MLGSPDNLRKLLKVAFILKDCESVLVLTGVFHSNAFPSPFILYIWFGSPIDVGAILRVLSEILSVFEPMALAFSVERTLLSLITLTSLRSIPSVLVLPDILRKFRNSFSVFMLNSWLPVLVESSI